MKIMKKALKIVGLMVVGFVGITLLIQVVGAILIAQAL